MRIQRNQPPYLGAMNWAALYALSTAGLAVGTQVLVTDWNQPFILGADGLWRPVGGLCLLYRISTAASVTGTTTETTLSSYTVPAGLLGAGGSLEVVAWYAHTSSANNKISRVRFAGTNVGAVTSSTNTTAMIRSEAAAVSTSTSRGLIVLSGSNQDALAKGYVSFSLDTTAAIPVAATSQLSDGGDSSSLVNFSVSLRK